MADQEALGTERSMDIVFIAAIVALFAVTAGLVIACEKLRKPS
jgi:hypothetical protein